MQHDFVESGLFEIVKVWVQDAFLIEFISEENVGSYTEGFGQGGMTTLDGKLRRLEEDLERKLLGVMPQRKLVAILEG